MAFLISCLPLFAALAVGAISPGPSFIFVARHAVAGSRTGGLAAALGMGVGGVIFGVAVLIGWQALLTTHSGLFMGFKTCGALYLVFLATRLWRQANDSVLECEMTEQRTASMGRIFLTALLTQLSNPKTLVVYGSIFAALLPRELPRAAMFVIPSLNFLVEAGWYAIVALALSSGLPRRTYLRAKPAIDRIAGGLLGLLGIKLLASASSST